MKKIKLKKYTDKRGFLVENTSPEVFHKARHFFISKSKPGVQRGNHYHKHKREWFYIFEGKAKIYLYDLKTKKRDVLTVSGRSPELVEVGPNTAHAIKNIGRDEMILLALVNEKFNPKKPDTFIYNLNV